MLLCTKCRENYIGETENLRERTNNSKSHVRNTETPNNPYAKLLCRCSNLREPYFYLYPFYYENNTMFKRFKEWRFIKRFKPSMNNKF